ncbi:hypothetical protein EDF77_3141 [Stenotrophomonas maltophilia]|uniref:hypothetical protein n=1 Tax=Stenotrophomonas chelatiphaga TaxID=517011 RepID=UPI000F4B1C4C|nr:hypothetical protein [Stenotrophomonas chelatiphaga]MCS4229880.1 hypothetical protein [Stenotrophomonas chelatiphaga]ROQ38067.1 hypothetical protein EDF77_3141 [Stenotrophomonas maltophilia]
MSLHPLPPAGAEHRFRSHYHALFGLVMLVNLGVIACQLYRHGWAELMASPNALAGLAMANIGMAILMRQSLVITALFWLATRAPVTWPLGIRRHLAKVYHYGGIHAGGACAGTAWLALLVGSLLSAPGDQHPPALRWTASALLGCLLGMLLSALPAVRARHHDAFEKVHRYVGWTTLLLTWGLAVQLGPSAGQDDARGGVPESALLVFLGMITASILLPWLRLRRIALDVQRPSPHAVILTLAGTRAPFPGSAMAISRSPLGQWHSFANIPAAGQTDFRIIISRAGDWTGQFIDDPPRHVWMKGFPTAGVAYIEVLFRSVLYVATGSGIGPVLPHLLSGRVRMRLIWSVRSPRATYGDALVDEILAAQPDALIWDTQRDGKPDLLQLSWGTAHDMKAEAVICIANRALTDAVVNGCEARGLPAYGAIWDS